VRGITFTEVTLSGVDDFGALGERWRRLEARANGSFFQSWSWTGCLVAERFPDPALVEATENGETVALALFNRRRGPLRAETLYLGESGVAAMDRLYIECNGVLTVGGRESELTPPCLHAARFGRRSPLRPRRLVLSGITDPARVAAQRIPGTVWARYSAAAPYVDLAAPRTKGGDYLAERSANTRQQIRRSDRAYAERGRLSLQRAGSAAEAHGFLDQMVPLHQASWTARSQPGCFADPFFARFHHELIDRGMPRGEIDLLRVTAGGELVGVLYNFRFGGRALAYQSGFDYAVADPRCKPGLSCHHQAIRFAAAAGLETYDFLAGDTRYKRSLADSAFMLHWVEIDSARSPRMMRRRIGNWLRARDATGMGGLR
jgi:CelD/BcsL family acetyltransferase involved in cellulose biosynthesis